MDKPWLQDEALGDLKAWFIGNLLEDKIRIANSKR